MGRARFVALGTLMGCSTGDVHPVTDASTSPVDVAVVDSAGDGAGDTARTDAAADAAAVDGFTTDVPASEASTGGCVPEGERKHSPMPDTFVTSQDEFAAVMFNSNPPSSGPHCNTPGQYGAYTAQPLPRCNYLENLARGGVVVVYNCPSPCNDLIQRIGGSLVGVTDPDCPGVRVVITSDKDLDVQVAAAAWGYTWRSTCFDGAARASLTKFINDHLGSRGEAPRRSPAMCP